jgi:F-type H+-transporting ATPase subunit gamma
MQMVAAAKMRRAQQNALAGRPYAGLMNQVLGEVTRENTDFTHPLLESRPVANRAVIVVSTDKGLCGSLNGNLLREAARFDKATTIYITAGRKASQFMARTKRNLAAEFTYKDAPLFAEARAISKFAQDLFVKGQVDEVMVVYTNFISTLVQQPETVRMLPIQKIEGVVASVHGEPVKEEPVATGGVDFLFEPSASTVLGALLPHYLNFKVYQILLEAKASEHSSRMVAMKNATDNAMQLIKDLSLEYNKLRQANITSELLEISTAAMAME